MGVTGDAVPQDPAKGLRYIFINEGDVYQKPNGEQVSYVTVVDTNNDTVRVPLLLARLFYPPFPTFCSSPSPTPPSLAPNFPAYRDFAMQMLFRVDLPDAFSAPCVPSRNECFLH